MFTRGQQLDIVAISDSRWRRGHLMGGMAEWAVGSSRSGTYLPECDPYEWGNFCLSSSHFIPSQHYNLP